MNESSSNTRITFTVEGRDPWSGARAGVLRTRRTQALTPVFMPVATQGSLRGAQLDTVADLGYPILLANTYHLLLRLGGDYLRQKNGLNNFCGWPRAFLTDSGGFQVFSLNRSCRMTEEGAFFRSYIDGSEVFLSPEVSIAMQAAIDSDIMMVLDQCIDATSERALAEQAVMLSARWAARSLAARSADSPQALFGIVQGACYHDLRVRSAELTTALPFDGFALGGLAVGESRAEREEVVAAAAPLLPSDKPRYLMGVGTPVDLLEAVRYGMDLFDCILPTNLAGQGVAFTWGGKIDFRRGQYRDGGDTPIDVGCECATCGRYTRSYLHHLIKSGEHVAHHLIATHNLFFYRSLMMRMRASIIEGSFRSFYYQHKESLERSDGPGLPPPPPRSAAKSPASLGDYEVVIRGEGQPGAIRQRSSGETMHSVLEGSTEAQALYVRQIDLLDRCGVPHSTKFQTAKSLNNMPLVIWDVGLGAATNAMAAIQALEAEASARQFRPIELVSFERDLDSLRLALKNSSLFPHLWHGAPHQLLRTGEWRSARVPLRWRLVHGDFLSDFLESPLLQSRGVEGGVDSPELWAPHVIWFDPFSSKVDSALWTEASFRFLLRWARAAVPDARGCTELVTYSASTAVRVALLAAGWYVAEGVATGQKSSTTVAYSANPERLGRPPRLLGARWLARWERSDARVPAPMRGTEQEAHFERLIRGHPQFQGCTVASGT